MSTTFAPMPADEAQNLQERVYQDVFFNKLAAAGYQPRTQEAAAAMLNTAARLREAEATLPQKQASVNDPFVAADLALQQVLAPYGVNGHSEKQAHDQLVQLAVGYAQHPDVYRSVLSLDHAAAQ